MPIYSTPPRAVQTAYVSYILYTLTPTIPPVAPLTSIQLTWPTSYQDSPYVVAAYMEINGVDYDPSFPIYLPDATQTSVGQNFIISNIGGLAANLYDFNQDILFTVMPGLKYYVILVDNSTPAGTWHFLTFGAATSSVVPSTLVGYGLNASALPPTESSLLNTQITSNPLGNLISQYYAKISDYTSLVVWQSGAGAITLPLISDVLPLPPDVPPTTYYVPPAYYVSINNSGTGQLAVGAVAGIQGSTSITLVPGDTVTLVALPSAIDIDGVSSQWLTLGRTNLNISTITVNPLGVGGASNITLTPQQAQSGIQEYSGTITANITVFFPAGTAGQWWVDNIIDEASDPFTLSVQLAGAIGASVVVPRGSRQLFFSDGLGGMNAGMKSIPFPIFPDTTVNNLEIASPSVDVILSVTQANSGIQQYTSDGALTADVIVFFPADLPGEWEVFNNTTGPHTVSVQLVGPLGNIYVIPQGSIQSFYSDGTTMQFVSSNAAGGTVTSVAVTSPDVSVTVTGSPITTTGTIDIVLPHVGANGTFTTPGSMTVDTYGRVTAATNGTNVVTANTALTAGQKALVGGTTTVATTAALTTSVILITPLDVAPVVGKQVTVSAISNGASFTITSSDNTDTSTMAWMIINPV